MESQKWCVKAISFTDLSGLPSRNWRLIFMLLILVSERFLFSRMMILQFGIDKQCSPEEALIFSLDNWSNLASVELVSSN